MTRSRALLRQGYLCALLHSQLSRCQAFFDLGTSIHERHPPRVNLTAPREATRQLIRQSCSRTNVQCHLCIDAFVPQAARQQAIDYNIRLPMLSRLVEGSSAGHEASEQLQTTLRLELWDHMAAAFYTASAVPRTFMVATPTPATC